MDFGGGSRPSPCFLGRIDGGQLIPVNLGTRARAEYFVNNLERRFKGWRDDVSLIQSAAFLSLPAPRISPSVLVCSTQNSPLLSSTLAPGSVGNSDRVDWPSMQHIRPGREMKAVLLIH
jgi:hypothetical protein